jgi:hypothetical protein
MIYKEITIGQSCQVVQIGQPEKWNKISVTAGFEETETIHDVGKFLMKRVEDLHKEIAPDAVAMFFNEPTQKVSIVDQVKNRLNGA